MTATETKPPTLKQLREEANRLGITPESAGCSIDELIKRARQTEDPHGYLATYAPAAEQTEPAEQILKTESGKPKAEIRTVLAELPLGHVPIDEVRDQRYHITRHVEAQLSLKQGITLRRLFLALDELGTRLADGKRIIRNADVIRWILEQAGGQ